MVGCDGADRMRRAAYPIYTRRSTSTPAAAVRFTQTVTRSIPPLADLFVPLLVAAVITVGGVAHTGDAQVVPLALGCAAGLSLLGRRRAPGLTLAISGALTLVLLHLEPSAGATAVLAPAVALYSLALRRGTRARAIAAIAAVAAVVVADRLHTGSPTLLQTLAHVLLVAIPLLLADVHRTRHANVALLQQRLELAERTREREAERRAEQERLRIARDLHDVIAHTLTSINVQASTAAHLLESNPDHARGALETIADASRDAIDELRAILGVLRDGDVKEAPLRPSPGLDDVAELVQRTRADGVDVCIEVVGRRPKRVAEAVSLAAYRIVQESLTNARRHAAGAPVQVTLAFQPDRLGVAVENGEGTPGPNGHCAGVGIMGMSERATSVGGTVAVRQLGHGYRVEAELPYARP
jgi:signal transduction histidine kinase